MLQGDRAADGRGGRRDDRPRAVRGRACRAARTCPATSRRRACRRDSRTETYAALRLEVHNWRWAGVPFFLRTGKRLVAQGHGDRGHAQAGAAPGVRAPGSVGVQPNQLVLTVQPNEGVSVSLGAKIPGSRMRIRPVNMEFLYGTSFMSQSPEAYERLILDAMRGDATLFTRNDEVDAQWAIIDPILEAWRDATPTAAAARTRPARPGPRRRTRCSATGGSGGGL